MPNGELLDVRRSFVCFGAEHKRIIPATKALEAETFRCDDTISAISFRARRNNFRHNKIISAITQRCTSNSAISAGMTITPVADSCRKIRAHYVHCVSWAKLRSASQTSWEARFSADGAERPRPVFGLHLQASRAMLARRLLLKKLRLAENCCLHHRILAHLLNISILRQIRMWRRQSLTAFSVPG